MEAEKSSYFIFTSSSDSDSDSDANSETGMNYSCCVVDGKEMAYPPADPDLIDANSVRNLGKPIPFAISLCTAENSCTGKNITERALCAP